mgnify:FL=1
MIRHMHRWITILLLVLLPLQSLWASAGSYCEHEQGSDVWHFGHHAHAHSDSAHGEPQSPTAKHPDCATCKLYAKTLAAVASTLSLPASTGLLPAQTHPPIATAPPTRIERPKWAGLAA